MGGRRCFPRPGGRADADAAGGHPRTRGVAVSTRPSFPSWGIATYGLGFFITTYRGHKLVWHSGSLDGYSLLFSFLPREKLGVLVLTNLAEPGDRSGHQPERLRPPARTRADRLVRPDEGDREKATKAQAGSKKPAAQGADDTLAPAGRLRRPLRASRYGPSYGNGTLTFESHHLSGPMSHHLYDFFAVRDPDQPDARARSSPSSTTARPDRPAHHGSPSQGVADIAYCAAWGRDRQRGPALAGLMPGTPAVVGPGGEAPRPLARDSPRGGPVRRRDPGRPRRRWDGQ